MKAMSFVLSISILSTPFLSASAEQTGAVWETGLYGGGQFGDSEIKSGAAVMGQLGLRFNPYFGIDAQGGFQPTTSKINTLSKADLSIASFELVPRIYAPLGRFQPYIGAGAARYFVSETLDPAINNDPAFNYEESVDGGWGGIFAGGFELAVNENVSLGLDLSYLYFRTTAHNSLTSNSTGAMVNGSQAINLDSVRVLAGVKVKFSSPGWMNVY